jgi:hypothetical protein
MYSLDGSVSIGNVERKAVGALEVYDDGTVLGNVSYLNSGGYHDPKMHVFRGKVKDIGPGSMTITGEEGDIRLSGIDFTHNTPYEDMMTADGSCRALGIRDDVN